MLICIQSIQDESDRNLVEKLFNRYSSTMLYIANGILKDSFQAEDAVSQAFIKIIDKLQYFSFENCNKTRALLVILVKDICYDMLKSEKSKKLVSLDDFENIKNKQEDAPLDHAISKESYDFMMTCIFRLNDRYKDILRLKLIYEYSDDDISQLLGISPDNVRVRFHRARKALIVEMRKGENCNG